MTTSDGTRCCDDVRPYSLTSSLLKRRVVDSSTENTDAHLVFQLDASLGDWRTFARTHIFAQVALIDHADMEFMLFRTVAFPGDKYTELVAAQNAMLLLLFSMERTLAPKPQNPKLVKFIYKL